MNLDIALSNESISNFDEENIIYNDLYITCKRFLNLKFIKSYIYYYIFIFMRPSKE